MPCQLERNGERGLLINKLKGGTRKRGREKRRKEGRKEGRREGEKEGGGREKRREEGGRKRGRREEDIYYFPLAIVGRQLVARAGSLVT